MTARLRQAIAACLLAGLVTGCTTPHTAGPPRRRPGELEAELSREIERMLRQHQRLQAERNRNSISPLPSAAPEIPLPASRRDRQQQFGLLMPVAGMSPWDLQSSFGDVRSGGRRHAGIDIFAPRGAAVVAVSRGYVSFTGTRPLAGRCLWLVSEEGRSYFYAHLNGWASGLWEGQEVAAGELLGYVGSSGNASGSSPHLHFEVHQDGDALDPYLILRAHAVNSDSELSR